MKWLWTYCEEDHTLWKEIITSKYGESNQQCSNNSSMPNECGAWRTIRDLWPKLEENMIVISGRQKKKFWGDAWNNQTPLKNTFPDLFSTCNNTEATVKECWTDQGWDLSFRRLAASLLLRLEDFTGTTPNPDSMKWEHNKDGIFSVKRAYETGNTQLNEDNNFCGTMFGKTQHQLYLHVLLG